MVVSAEFEQELAHMLLVELLAHQFTMPVRWIETQEYMLSTLNVETFIEVGPSPTLSNMMSRTMDQFYTTKDVATNTQRRLLSVKKDYDAICFQDRVEEPTQNPEPAPSPQLEEISTPVKTERLITKSAVGTGTLALIPDQALSPSEAVFALIANNLNKSPHDLAGSDTISTLSKGRSILQNEIIGDLLAEFGQLPESPQDISLDEISRTVKMGANNTFGKCLGRRVQKMVGSKMPGSFDLDSLRSAMVQRWGLQSGRQNAVLLLMLSQQPTSRLNDATEALDFLDRVVGDYMTLHGLEKQASQEAVVDTAGLSQVTEALGSQIRQERTAMLSDISAILTAQAGKSSLPATEGRMSEKLLADAQTRLDQHTAELDDEFLDGIQPRFSPEKIRTYDSVWNWAAVDLVEHFHRWTRLGTQPTAEEATALRRRFANRWDDRLESIRRYLLSRLDSSSTAEVLREWLNSLGGGLEPEPNSDLEKPIEIPLLPREMDVFFHRDNGSLPGSEPVIIETISDTSQVTSACSTDSEEGSTDRRSQFTEPSSPDTDASLLPSSVSVSRRRGAIWRSDNELSQHFQCKMSTETQFSGKTVLVTGAGPGSIAFSLLPHLLQGGARVILGTSRPPSESAEVYAEMFREHGGFGSSLLVVPFNQASKTDVYRLVDYIFDIDNGLGDDVDYIVPFAAIPQNDRSIENIDGKAELAHRAMLTNVTRLLGAVKASKAARGTVTRPAQVILPLSPNTGTFGRDGLYAESKAGLLVLLNKWHSEDWADYLSVCGLLIGWTQGTGLMSGNDELVTAIRRLGVTTFSQKEMSRHILKAMSEPIASACQEECLLVDVSGGLDEIPNIGKLASTIRESLRKDKESQVAVAADLARDSVTVLGGARQSFKPTFERLKKRANMTLPLPVLPDSRTQLDPLRTKLRGMVDLSTTVVICGFSEIGPWGSARTRWEREAWGEFSLEGCLELAWITGLIQYGPPLNDGGSTGAWLDSETGEVVEEDQIKARYESQILEHTGLRLIEPKHLDHPQRDKTQMMQEVVVQQDLKPFVTSYENAQEFLSEHGDKVEVRANDAGSWTVGFKAGARIFVPKARDFDRIVGGMLPKGWSGRLYGLPEDICDHVDECTVMALVCAAEAFLSAGIVDVYDLYKGMHVSEIANCVGSGVGGQQAAQRLFRERFLGKEVQSDILAEMFINTTAAWLNMLLMGSAGPTRTPVGACATALESLNQGFDLISSGAAKICLVGGVDSMTHDVSAEFAQMRATNNTAADLEQSGRLPSETSRPCTTSRKGFVEAEGCGMQVLASAQTALDLGLPIWAVVADVRTASDGTGRSVPAPGQGLLANVRSLPGIGPSPLLDVGYRRRLLEHRLSMVEESRRMALGYAGEQFGLDEAQQALLSKSKSKGCGEDGGSEPGNSLGQQLPSGLQDHISEIHKTFDREREDARRALGNRFWVNDDRIPPLCGALAVWNLTVDDVAVVSMHGTSTQANENNECEVVHRQFDRLGRAKGNPALVVCQKHLTGHPKAAAAAWMLNGCCQMADAGFVPGNRNADNIDAKLQQWHHLLFPSHGMRVGDIKAFSLSSFGFGQKGSQAIGVHPRYCFAAAGGEDEFREYCARREDRFRRAQRHFQNSFYGRALIEVKDGPPYPREKKAEALMDAGFRYSGL